MYLNGFHTKGRCTSEEQEYENSEAFRSSKGCHSAVESAINALGHTGLDRCRDKGIKGFRRYVALAVLSRNIQRLGAILQKQEIDRQKCREKVRVTWMEKNKEEMFKQAS